MREHATFIANVWREADRILWREVGEFACFGVAEQCIETRMDLATRHLPALARTIDALQAAGISGAELLGTADGIGIRIALYGESWTAEERADAWRELALEVQCAAAVRSVGAAHG